MKVLFLPKSRSGRLAVWLSLGVVAVFLLLYLLGEQLNLLAPALITVSAIIAILAAFAGGILAFAAITNKDMAVMLFLPLLVVLLMIYFIFVSLGNGGQG